MRAAEKFRGKYFVSLLKILAVGFYSLPLCAAAGGSFEFRGFERLEAPTAWAPAECALGPSERGAPVNGAVLLMNIPVDHTAGEPKYPIGWPRAGTTLKEGEGDWTGWDSFEFWVYAESSRERLPSKPLGLTFGRRPLTCAFELATLALGSWTNIRVPLALLKEKDLPLSAMEGFQFYISESTYQHKDQVSFHLAGLRLVRRTELALEELRLLTPVLYANRPVLRLALIVSGPAGTLGYELLQGGKRLHAALIQVAPGVQLVERDLSALKAPPGEYEIALAPGDPAQKKTARFRIVEAP